MRQDFICEKCELESHVIMPDDIDAWGGAQMISTEHRKWSPACDGYPDTVRLVKKEITMSEAATQIKDGIGPWEYKEELRARMSYIGNDKVLICAIPNETWDNEALAQQRKKAKLICDALNSYEPSQKRIEELTAAFTAYVAADIKDADPKVLGLCEKCSFPVYASEDGELWHYAKGTAVALLCPRAALKEGKE